MHINNQDALNQDSNDMCGFNNRWYPGTPLPTIIKKYETRTLMQRGYDEIIATYDKETMEEIADHGCQSGVCSQHIYYGDTIKFFDKYEDEIMDHFTGADNGYGDTEFLIDMFKDADACLNIYKNNMTWAYIESVAFQVTEDALEEPELTTYGAIA